MPNLSESASQATILAVDDQPENLIILAQILQPHYRVRAARSGEEALRVAASDPAPDLLLLDIMMPGMDGYKVCEIFKSDPANETVPVIFLSAKVEDEDILLGLELGAVDYITKPFNPAILLARVKNHLRLGQYEKLLFQQANVDLLTLLPNRRRFDGALHHEWRRAARAGLPLGLILAEIDVADDISEHSRDEEYEARRNGTICDVSLILEEAGNEAGYPVFHYGDAQFAILLAGQALPEVEEFAERLRAQIAEEQIPHPARSANRFLAANIGTASLRPQLETKATALTEAAEERVRLARPNGVGRACAESSHRARLPA